MKTSSPAHYTLSACAVLTMLGGCGGSQTPFGAFGPMSPGAANPKPVIEPCSTEACIYEAHSATRLAQSAVGPGVVVQFVYVTNFGSKNVSAYKINATSGALTPVAGSPFGAGSEPGAMAVDPNGKFAYVANAGSQNVSAYTISTSSGALTQVAGSPFSVGAASRWRSS